MADTSPKELPIENENNKLQCNVFFEINFAPTAAQPLLDWHFEKDYLIKIDDHLKTVNLVNFWRVPFKNMHDWVTIAATGLPAPQWKFAWKELHPETTDETQMGIYCYMKKIYPTNLTTQ